MDIVRNARALVKVDYFCLTDGEEPVLTAIKQVMELFGVKPQNPLISSAMVPAEDTVLIKNCLEICPEGRITVKTTIFFNELSGTMASMIFCQAAEASEDKLSVIQRLIKLNVLSAMRKLCNPDAAPWGILRGIRPTKIIHRFLDKGLHGEAAMKKLENDYGVDHEKATLITDIALRQRKFLLSPEQIKRTVSVYIGIPYCPSKCLYCSFPAYILPGQQQVNLFLQSLQREINAVAAMIRHYHLTVQSVYVGGGTPTSLHSAQFSELLSLIQQSFVMAETEEFTVEAGRPDSVDQDKIAAMCKLGVTRVSVNPQSMQEKTLKLIGRKHTTRDIINLFQKIRHTGIPVINMDVIVGLPGEDEKVMMNTMEQISELNPDNLTIHTLALKKGSLLKSNLVDYKLPDEHTTQQMLEVATAFASKMQMKPYYLYRQKYMKGNLENVGYSKPGAECLYNIQMMEERQTIFGIGPAATTKVIQTTDWSLKNIFNAKDISTYSHKIDDTNQRCCQLLAESLAQ